MDDQGKGADLVKTGLGLLLLVGGNYVIFHLYPRIPEIILLKDGKVSMSPSAGDHCIYLAQYCQILTACVMGLNLGALMLFWGSFKKS